MSIPKSCKRKHVLCLPLFIERWRGKNHWETALHLLFFYVSVSREGHASAVKTWWTTWVSSRAGDVTMSMLSAHLGQVWTQWLITLDQPRASGHFVMMIISSTMDYSSYECILFFLKSQHCFVSILQQELDQFCLSQAIIKWKKCFLKCINELHFSLQLCEFVFY